MDYTCIRFEVDRGLARLTLDRPDAGHALNEALGRELMDAAIRCGEEPGIRAVLLSATGKAFGFGGDLKFFESRADRLGATLKELTTCFHQAIQRFQHMDAPLVVAVQGMAAGAGMSLALVGDIVIAGESARFRMAYTAAGLVPDGSSTHYLPRLVGLRRAQELTFTNRQLDAAEALAWGVVTRVVPDAELAAEAENVARNLADGPTLAYGLTKRMLARTFSNTLETQMEDEARAITAAAQTADGRGGVAAFIAKRKPAFRGE